MQHTLHRAQRGAPASPAPAVSIRLIAVALLAAVTVIFAGCASLAGSGQSASADMPVIDGIGITLFAAGDIADCRQIPAAKTGAARTAALIAGNLANDPAALVLALGDTSYPAGLPEEYENCYAPTWGRFKAQTLPAPGNHEYYTKGAPGYFGYFGALAGPEQRGYYSKDVGNWHLVSLNSNLRPPASTAQQAWLVEDLAQLRRRNADGCVLAYWHHPVYSSGGHGNNAHMRATWQALMAARADVVLSAHDHDYERFAPQDADANRDERNGIRSFVVGTGGAELDPFTLTKPHSQAQENLTHGVLKMVLKRAGYEWAFLPVDGKPARDAGSARCHSG